VSVWVPAGADCLVHTTWTRMEEPIGSVMRSVGKLSALRLSYGERGDVVLPGVVPHCLDDPR
jgi:hypothetical protein